jgi:glycosyltransferase involved in cell wall biosynthesis
MNPPRTTILFDNLGPYHIARLAAAAKHLPIQAIEFSGRSAEYPWDAPDSAGVHRVTLNPGGPAGELPPGEFRKRLRGELTDARPNVIAIPGWSGHGAFVAMEWAMEQHVPYILMSDSTEWDEPRVAWKEAIKARLVGGASAALVAGTPHADYMRSLGMPPSRTFTGYDVVDNDCFSKGAELWRGHPDHSGATQHPYFLASCRFVTKKNLEMLLDSYAAHVPQAVQHRTSAAWDLCLLGDGELKPDLMLQAGKLGLEILFGTPWECPLPAHARGRLFLPGFRQIGGLFRFYAGAGAFIHASITEQWGLVVNEAMASGIPVAVSDRCGCASDLVQQGENGWTFPPADVAALRELLLRFSTIGGTELRRMGAAGRSIISSWGPQRFSDGLRGAVETALAFGPPSNPTTTRLMLQALALASR